MYENMSSSLAIYCFPASLRYETRRLVTIHITSLLKIDKYLSERYCHILKIDCIAQRLSIRVLYINRLKPNEKKTIWVRGPELYFDYLCGKGK